MLGTTFRIQALTNSETLFNVIIRNASNREKLLTINVQAAWGSYNEGIIDDVIWIKRKFNLRDAITKEAILLEFVEALDKNKLHYEVEQSVNRMILSPTTEMEKVRVSSDSW